MNKTTKLNTIIKKLKPWIKLAGLIALAITSAWLFVIGVILMLIAGPSNHRRY